MRTVFFGGTFDPPHNGHLMIAFGIIGLKLADQVLFVPAFVPPHKPGLPVSDFHHRLKMLELTLSGCGDPRLCLSNIEYRLHKRPSFTAGVLEALEKEGVWGEISLVMGSDSLLTLHTWNRADEIVDRWNIITYPRPGYFCGETEISSFWPPEITKKLLSSIIWKLPESKLASTDLRCKISRNENVSDMLPEKVLEYVLEHRLYNREKIC